MQRSVLVEVQQQQKLIFLPPTTGLVQLKFVAKLTFQYCGKKGGAERKVCVFEENGFFREVQVSLVSTERDE